MNLTLAMVIATGAFWSTAAAQPVTIAAMGDSLTHGYGVPLAEGFVPTLAAWLDENGQEVDMVNAGVSGDTTSGGLSRVDWTLTPEVDGMIVALGGNDLLRGIDPAVSRENLDGILAAAEAAEVPVLLVGISAPPNYGAEYQADFEAMYVDLAEKYGTLYEESFLGALERIEDRTRAMRDYMQADGIHPNAAGVDLIVEALGPRVVDLADRARVE